MVSSGHAVCRQKTTDFVVVSRWREAYGEPGAVETCFAASMVDFEMSESFFSLDLSQVLVEV